MSKSEQAIAKLVDLPQISEHFLANVEKNEFEYLSLLLVLFNFSPCVAIHKIIMSNKTFYRIDIWHEQLEFSLQDDVTNFRKPYLRIKTEIC